jgi:hypothetical protein
MILDERTEFVDGVAIPTSAGTAAIGDVIDLESLGGSGLGGLRDVGNGREIFWYVSIDEAGTGGTSMNVQLVSSAAANLGTPTIHAQTGVVLLADLTGGKTVAMISVPLEGPAYKRYLGIQAVVAGTFTGGSFSSGLTLDSKGWKPYAEGDN